MKRKIHRDDILDAGYDLMYLNGYHATGIKEITDKILIPKGSFYNHFSSKEAFAIEMLQRYSDTGIRFHQKNLLNSKANTPLNRLFQFYEKIVDVQSKQMNDTRGCLLGNFSQEMSGINEKFRAVLDLEFNRCEKVIATCIEEAIEEGEIKNAIDSNHTASFILNSWHGALLRMKSTGTAKPLNDFMQFLKLYLVNQSKLKG